MNITIERKALLSGLQSVIGAVSSRSVLPMLKCVLFVVENDSLILTGTDMEVELVATVRELTIIETGAITIPAKKLHDIVRTLPDDEPLSLTLEKGGDNVLLTQGRRKFKLQSLPASDFPNLESWDQENTIALPAEQVSKLLTATAASMANQDVRYYLNGTLLELGKSNLIAVATDGHRLSISKQSVEADERTTSSSIVPRSSIVELIKLLNNQGSNTIQMVFGNNHLRIEMPDLIFSTKLIDGRFPDYRRVIPKEHPTKFVLNRDELKSACSRLMIVVSEQKQKGGRLSFRADAVDLFSSNSEHEVAEESIGIQSGALGEGVEIIEIGVNLGYMMDALNSIGSDELVIELLDGNSSILMYSADEDANSRYVLMPLRL